MPGIADIRAKYPQYDDLSDEALADGFYKKFYSDMPREEFDEKLGLKQVEKAEEKSIDPLATTKGLTRGIEQGASLGFSDEIGAAAEASGLPEVSGPFSAIARPAVGFVRSLVSDEGAKEYEAALARRREEIAAAEEQSPGAFLAGNVAGGLATAPFTPVARAATVGGRMLAGAATGAGYGAAYGAGTGESAGERLGQAASGALVGGVTGGVASPVVDAVIAGGRAAGRALAPLRGATNPEKEASRRVVGALEADSGPGAADRAASVLESAQEAGTPLVVADTGGEMTRGLARSSANTSPEAREALEGVTGDRFGNQADRFTAFTQEITGATGDTAALQARVQNVGRTVNKKAYNEAYKEGAVGAWDDELASITQSPDVQDAIRGATRTGLNKSVIGGFDAQPNPFVFKDGRMDLRVNEDGSRAIPTLQFWDAVKQNLDDKIGALSRAGEKQGARDLIAIKNAIVEKMDAAFPAYKNARAGASAFFDAEDALEAGTKMVSSPMGNDELRRGFQAMSPAERELAKNGYANELMRRVSGMGDGRNVAGANFLKSPQARDRMDIVLGKQGARKMEAFVEVENLMNTTKRAVEGNSTTARQLIEAGLAGGSLPVAGGGVGYFQGDDYGSAAVGALIGLGMRKGYNLIDAKLATRVGHMLASNDPEVLRKAVKMVSGNPRLLKALRAGQEYIGRLTASETGSVNLPAMIPGRAEDEQQPVNGM